MLVASIITFSSYGQNFSNKDIKRMQPVLKRSQCVVRDFNKSALISIERTNNPPLEGHIESAFFKAGFTVVSNRVARESVRVSNPLSSKIDTVDISRQTTYSSVYLVTVNGNIRPNIGRCYDALADFSARIIDLANDGRLVATFSFTGNAISYYACMEDAAVALVYSLINQK